MRKRNQVSASDRNAQLSQRTKNRSRSRHAALSFREVVRLETLGSSPDFKSWFDMWHHHVDWNGDGRLSRQHRKFELWALFKLLRRFEYETRHMRDRCQVFAIVHENDPGNDAIYIHSPNPNSTPFPYRPQVNELLTSLPLLLTGHINLERYDVAMETYYGDKYYSVQRKL